MVYPNPKKGLSFADSVETLARKELEGHVWMIRKGTPIPEKLVFNAKDYDHPLLNVAEPMSALDFTILLNQLMEMMEPCHIKIKEHGKLSELRAGARNALKKVSG